MDETSPGATIEGHVGKTVPQVFQVRRTRTIEDRRLKLKAVEYLLEDQFKNLYLVYRSILSDGEVYDVADWVKPSLIASYGGFNDALITHFMEKAFVALGRATLGLMREKHAGAQVLGYGRPTVALSDGERAQATELIDLVMKAGVKPGPPKDKKVLPQLKAACDQADQNTSQRNATILPPSP